METPFCCSFAFVCACLVFLQNGCLPRLFIEDVCVRVCAYMYLLLVFPLQVQSSLDISSCLLKGLPLGDLSRVVGADPDHVSAQEDQHVGTDLKAHVQTDNHEKQGTNRNMDRIQ